MNHCSSRVSGNTIIAFSCRSKGQNSKNDIENGSTENGLDSDNDNDCSGSMPRSHLKKGRGVNRAQSCVGEYFGSKSCTLPSKKNIQRDWTVPLELKFSVDDIAGQMTLLDLSIFKNITYDELKSLEWTGDGKFEKTPNIVAYTWRFNSVISMVQQEILYATSLKVRVGILSHYIRLARKLHDLNNLHGEFAVISALHSAPIYRLKRTWESIPRKELVIFENATQLFIADRNFENLRQYLDKTKLPCVPYLGLYLTDLIFTDVAFTANKGIPEEKIRMRESKLDTIITSVLYYQDSHYPGICNSLAIQKYLNSVQYREEWRKFMEKDFFRLSLVLEPNETAKKMPSMATACLPFPIGHSKTQSLGNNLPDMMGSSDYMVNQLPYNVFCDSMSESEGSLLDDDTFDGIEVLPPEKCSFSFDEPLNTHSISLDFESMESSSSITYCGILKLKTILKHAKPTFLRYYKTYWAELTGFILKLYQPKKIKPFQRSDFKDSVYRTVNLQNWMAVPIGNPIETRCFEISDPFGVSLYRVKVKNESELIAWVEKINFNSRPQNKGLSVIA